MLPSADRRFFAVTAVRSYDPGVRSRLTLVSVLLALACPAVAQDAAPAPAPRPVGAYDGVEPGEAQPPPAYDRVVRRARGRRGVILTWPGFSPLGDGGSRFFVQTVQPMQPELRVEEGRVVVLFHDTTIHVRNSGRWLETRFFNTPVLRARLERRRRDMALVLHMRAAAVPRISSEAAPGGTFHYVYIDFPPGDYAPVVSAVPEAQPPAAPARDVDPTLDAMDDERPPGM
jgi:hypothetical protein